MTAVSLERRRPYHVGNVRGQLLAAARDILQERGRAGLSLRAIADRGGVAPGTVYYHYADKAALLAGLAVDGFRQLSDAMKSEYEMRGHEGGLRAIGSAYLNFLREKPELYELMYVALDAGRREDVAAAEAEGIGLASAELFAAGHYPAPQAVRLSISHPLDNPALEQALATLARLLDSNTMANECL